MRALLILLILLAGCGEVWSTYGLSSAKKLPHAEPPQLSAEGADVKLVAPAETIVEIGHLDGWGSGLYGGASIFMLWTRGNVHEKFVALVAQGRGTVKVRVGSCRLGFQNLEIGVD